MYSGLALGEQSTRRARQSLVNNYSFSRPRASGRLVALQKAFEIAFITSGGIDGAAMFAKRMRASDADWFYSTPRGEQLIALELTRRGAEKTSAPDPENVSLLVGSQDELDRLRGEA
ncbi:hypothetical protein GCM10011322_22180 [Salinarimonas ramus]|uniref:Uncharacterized protein n=1 Tax=Salinarimonas ramus TaxID=690164 RepID=A0A917Q827_9HYPH|nr:hypothetical protein GCM10011322_22180 [Salinarimonas ramus]